MSTDSKTESKSSQFFKRLAIPTHPNFDLERDSGTLDYVPPVVLNNRVVLYTNALIEIAEQVVELNRGIERLKLDKRRVERLRDQRRTQLLAQHPAPTSATKNLLLTDAYVLTLAKNDGCSDVLAKWEDEIAAFDDAIDLKELEVRNCKSLTETIKLACENIRTHLSFVKQEARLHGYAPIA